MAYLVGIEQIINNMQTETMTLEEKLWEEYHLKIGDTVIGNSDEKIKAFNRHCTSMIEGLTSNGGEIMLVLKILNFSVEHHDYEHLKQFIGTGNHFVSPKEFVLIDDSPKKFKISYTTTTGEDRTETIQANTLGEAKAQIKDLKEVSFYLES